VLLNVNYSTKKQNQQFKELKSLPTGRCKCRRNFQSDYDPTGREKFLMAGNFCEFLTKERIMMSGPMLIILFPLSPCQYDLTAHSGNLTDQQRLGLGKLKA